MAYEIKKKDSSDVIEPEVVQDSAESGKNSVLSAGDQSKLIDGGVEIAKKLADGLVEIARIREKGNQEVAKIRAQAEEVIAQAKANIMQHEQEHAHWEKRFDKRKELYLEAVRLIRNWNLPPESESAHLEVLKEVLKNDA